MDTIILGIESSCDDTSAAVIKNGVLLSNVVSSQAVHEAYGGVVPELASRAHQQNIVPVVHEALKRAGVTKEQLSAVAFTRGPGLMGSLLAGVSFAKGFARSLNIPMRMALWIESRSKLRMMPRNSFSRNSTYHPCVVLARMVACYPLRTSAPSNYSTIARNKGKWKS